MPQVGKGQDRPNTLPRGTTSWRNDNRKDVERIASEIAESSSRIVTAKRPNHVWHVDLTVVPTAEGFWTSWIPFSRPQQWPFCWWVAVAIDHYSRRLMGFTVFAKVPESAAVRAFLGRAIAHAKEVPNYIISDKGKQFWCDGYRNWCRRKGIKPRFGAAGERGKRPFDPASGVRSYQ